MSELDKIVFIYYLLGDSNIGKKEIISRFKKLNSSNTIIEEDKTFKKIYTISNYNFELKFYKIIHADPIQLNDNMMEDDENFKNHKLDFTNLIKEIKSIKSEIPQSENYKEVFLFCFDLSNYQSLERLKIYYEELCNLFQLDKSYKALIGNKLDNKKPMGNEEVDLINFFRTRKLDDNLLLDQTNLNKLLSDDIPYYEISTKNFFNFERFYERFFFDLFEKTDPEFQTQYFKERFRNIMVFKPTFAKSERNNFKSNNVPGPQKYPANVYDLVLENENQRTKLLNKFFRGKTRYTNKIFVNKTGPVFSHKKGGDYIKKNQMEKSQDNEDNNAQAAIPFPKEYYQKLYNNFTGFTFGIKTHKKINLREKRKEEFQKLKNSFDDIFENEKLHNITNTKFYEKNKDLMKKRPKTTDKLILKSTINNRPKTTFKTVSKEELIKKREEEILSKVKNKEYIKPPTEVKQRISYFDENKRKTLEPIPGPGSYEIAGSIQQNKGYTFGTKSNNTDILVKTAPAFVLLPSDFENIEEHATFSKANRFSTIKAQFEPIINADENNKKISCKIEQKIRKDIDKRKEYLDRLVEKEKIEAKKAENQNPGPGAYDVKYDYTEDKLPQYSLGGRLEKPHQGHQISNEDPSKIYNLEQSYSQFSKNVTNTMYPLPNYNIVKPNTPCLLFGTAERFPQQKPSERPGHNLYNKFDSVEINNDKNKVLYFGKSERFTELQKTFFQGPELYKITGFAENLVRKNEKFNELKQRKRLKSLNRKKTSDNFSLNNDNVANDNMKEKV